MFGVTAVEIERSNKNNTIFSKKYQIGVPFANKIGGRSPSAYNRVSKLFESNIALSRKEIYLVNAK